MDINLQTANKSVRYTDYGGKYLKIRKAIHKAGFDDFYQAGSINNFHKMNIVAESSVLKRRYWFCVDGGYSVKDYLYVAVRSYDVGAPTKRIQCANQDEMVGWIETIRLQIEEAKKHEQKES